MCAGNPNFGVPLHLQVALLFNSQAQTYGAGLVWGGKRFFGSGELGLTMYKSPISGDAVDFGGGFGLQVTPSSRIHVCPEVSAAFSHGPNNIGGSGIDLRERHFAGGVDASVVALDDESAKIIPYASYAIVSSRVTLTSPTSPDSSIRETFSLLTLGLSFGFTDQVLFGPSLTFPFGLEGGATTFGVSFSIRLGEEP
jgi:hypothetical protein